MRKQTRQLLAENNALAEQLTPEGGRLLTDIVVYLRTAPISEYQQELVRRDITQMLLEGQRRGQTAGEVLGGNPQDLCERILAELPHRSAGQRVLSALGNTCLYLAVLIAIWFCSHLFQRLLSAEGWPYLPVTVGNLVSVVVILCACVGLVLFLSKRAFRTDGRDSKRLFLLFFVALLLSFLANLLFREWLFTLHAGIAAAGIAALFLAYKLISARVD